MMRRRSIVRVAALVAAALAAWSAVPLDARQQAAAAASEPVRLAVDPTLASHVLANGLEVIVFEDHSLPLVTTELVVRNGSFTEPPELNGLSHLYEHMFFKANQATLDGEAYMRTIDQLGIVYNGQTREESVTYYLTTTTPNFPVAVRYLRDAARYPVFDPRQLAEEKIVVIDELSRNLSNPYGALEREMTAQMFSRYTSRKSPAGTPETVRAATPDAMRLIQNRYYVPNNSALIVAGDVSPQAVFDLAEELFGSWPRRAIDPFVEFPLVDHPPLTASRGAVITSPVQNVFVEVGWHGPSIGKDDAATYAADVFSWILRQPGSRLQRVLVDSGLVAGVGLNYYTQRNVGPITAVLQTTPENAREAVATFYAEVARFASPDYYSDEELEHAKVALEAEALFEREKPSEYIHSIAFWWSTTGLDYYKGYLSRLRATSRADIARYVQTYIVGKPHVALAMMSDASARAARLTEADLVGTAAAAGSTR